MRCLQPLLLCPSHHDELDLELGAKASLPLLRLFLSERSVTVTEKGSEGLLILFGYPVHHSREVTEAGI